MLRRRGAWFWSHTGEPQEDRFLRALLLKVWSKDQPHWHPWRAIRKCGLAGPPWTCWRQGPQRLPKHTKDCEELLEELHKAKFNARTIHLPRSFRRTQLLTQHIRAWSQVLSTPRHCRPCRPKEESTEGDPGKFYCNYIWTFLLFKLLYLICNPLWGPEIKKIWTQTCLSFIQKKNSSMLCGRQWEEVWDAMRHRTSRRPPLYMWTYSTVF